jgi:hypothetical protein
MKTLATCALLCGLFAFAACGENAAESNDTNQGSSQPADNPSAETETVVLNVQGMT